MINGNNSILINISEHSIKEQGTVVPQNRIRTGNNQPVISKKEDEIKHNETIKKENIIGLIPIDDIDDIDEINKRKELLESYESILEAKEYCEENIDKFSEKNLSGIKEILKNKIKNLLEIESQPESLYSYDKKLFNAINKKLNNGNISIPGSTDINGNKFYFSINQAGNDVIISQEINVGVLNILEEKGFKGLKESNSKILSEIGNVIKKPLKGGSCKIYLSRELGTSNIDVIKTQIIDSNDEIYNFMLKFKLFNEKLGELFNENQLIKDKKIQDVPTRGVGWNGGTQYFTVQKFLAGPDLRKMDISTFTNKEYMQLLDQFCSAALVMISQGRADFDAMKMANMLSLDKMLYFIDTSQNDSSSRLCDEAISNKKSFGELFKKHTMNGSLTPLAHGRNFSTIYQNDTQLNLFQAWAICIIRDLLSLVAKIIMTKEGIINQNNDIDIIKILNKWEACYFDDKNTNIINFLNFCSKIIKHFESGLCEEKSRDIFNDKENLIEEMGRFFSEIIDSTEQYLEQKEMNNHNILWELSGNNNPNDDLNGIENLNGSFVGYINNILNDLKVKNNEKNENILGELLVISDNENSGK